MIRHKTKHNLKCKISVAYFAIQSLDLSQCIALCSVCCAVLLWDALMDDIPYVARAALFKEIGGLLAGSTQSKQWRL